MSGSENGEREVVSPGRVLGARSASPAKRRAGEMEGSQEDDLNQISSMDQAAGSFAKESEGGRTDFDEAMRGMTPVGETQAQSGSIAPSTAGSASAMDTNTSVEEGEPPPYSAVDRSPVKLSRTGEYTTEEIDKQVATVMAKNAQSMEQGQKGVLVSLKWLHRVMSRSSEGLKSGEFSKDSREGPIGPVDNSDIVPEDAFTEPILHDIEDRPFIPLKPGLSIQQDFEIFNSDAWGVIVSEYGIKAPQKSIDRYVRNTAGEDAAGTNLQYELYPPVFTIRKVPQPGQDVPERPPSSLSAGRLRAERYARGQKEPDDAVKLVSSRQEKFQKFLLRSKLAAGIPKKSKVRIFRLLDPSKTAVDTQPSGESATAESKALPAVSSDKLVLGLEDFSKMDIGQELEYIDARDETDNDKYNGSSNMETFILTESATLLLEEQVGGAGGGEYNSDKKNTVQKIKLAELAKKNTGSQPPSTTNSGRTSPAPASMMTRGRTRRDGRTRGTVGLSNLGNTCYMNSALQCIRSVEELAVYFLSNQWKRDVNHSNPLGHNGAMAKHYANLLGQMYTESNATSVSPNAFKKALGSFAPMFSGYGQQDSQEFLSFLVDALHEDLNRILKKPYNENPDSDDNTVKDPQKIIELGEIYRKNHRARNDSVAMDLFSGFYKNTMECPVCDKISITFDPFSLVTLQLPNEGGWQHTVTFIPLDGTPINHAIDCDKSWSIKRLKENIASKHSGVDVDRLWMVEIYGHRIYKVFENSSTLSELGIQASDKLFIFELEAMPTNLPEKAKAYQSIWTSKEKVPAMDDSKADHFAVPVFSRQKSRSGYSWEAMLHPVYITLTREEAKDYETVLKKVLVAVSRLTSRAILTEMSADGEPAEKQPSEAGDEAEGAAGDAQVTDTSGSEDGYIRVSLGSAGAQPSKTEQNGDETNPRAMPKDFMEPEYFLSPVLRNQLFQMGYASGQDGTLHCTGMNSFVEPVRNMFDRVKKPSRRNSTLSTTSDESLTSTGSGAAVNGEVEESDAAESFDQPDLVLGSGDAMDESEEELPDNPLQSNMSRRGRRKNAKKGGRGKKNARKQQRTYGKHNNRSQHGRYNSGGSSTINNILNRDADDEDNAYYIKLGEGIILDWYPESTDALFGGSPNESDDLRGHFLSSADGSKLPFIPDPEIEAKKLRRENRRKHGITLDECFEETGKRETLSEDNAWYCNRCKELRCAKKTLEIWTCPDILVVHLKRFGGNRSFRDKIDTLVEYPVEGLDMTERVGLKEDGKGYVYDLFGVDCHFGGLGGGHYTAMAKNFYDGQWYDYNDSQCTRISSESRLQSSAAYLLFYRRRSDRPLGPQYLQDLVTNFRNPDHNADEADANADDDDESGEGRLGGPNGFSRGPSSVLQNGVGAGAMIRHPGVGAGGDGVGAGGVAGARVQTREGMGMIRGKPVYGPERPAHLQDGGWNFGGLDDGGDGDVEMEGGFVRDSVEKEDVDEGFVDGGDADSTAAQGDIDERDDDTFDDRDFVDAMPQREQEDLEPMLGDWTDEHSHYSAAHTQRTGSLEALHLEDAGVIGGEVSDIEMEEMMPVLNGSPPTPESEEVGHVKMD